ncbi:hypothetical protein [Sphingobium sp.]|uniref:hypothetical protein n=1 Tax=Sphingobium sp. TaxID=1912891 RepID=UPI003B39FECF
MTGVEEGGFRQEIAGFFDRYVDAFICEDADAIADLWEPVGLFPSPTGNFAMERPAFRDHVVGLLAFYRRQGVVRPVVALMDATALFPDVAQARVAYRMEGADGAVVAQWEHVYILRRSDGWGVSLTIADGEMAAWVAAGAQF